MADSSTLDPERVQAALRLESAGMLPPEHLAAVQRLRSAGQFPDPMTSSSTTTTPTSGTPGSEPTSYALDALDAPPFLGGIAGTVGGQMLGGPVGGMVGSSLGRAAGQMVSTIGRTAPTAARNVGAPVDVVGSEAKTGALQGLGAEAAAQGLGRLDDVLGNWVVHALRTSSHGSMLGALALPIAELATRAIQSVWTPDNLRGPINAGISAVDQSRVRRIKPTAP